MGPKRKEEKSSTDEINSPEAVILDYLNSQYRPYSANDIHQNLHGEFGKTAVVKALENLSSKGDISMKMFGKMGVYVAKGMETGSKSTNTNQDLEKSIETLQSEIEISNSKIDLLDAELLNLHQELTKATQYPDDDTLGSQISTLEAEIECLNKKLKSLELQPSYTEEFLKEVKVIVVKVSKETDMRGKMYKNFMSLLSEHIDPKTLINDLGLEEPQKI